MTEQLLFNKKGRDLDPEIWSLARREEMGELHGVYHARQYTAQTITGPIVLLAFGIFYSVYIIIPLCFGMLSMTWPGLLWFVPGFPLVGLGVALLIPRPVYTHWHIYLWEYGFIYQKGSLRQAFCWSQTESIQGSTGTNPQNGYAFFNYKVRRQDGYEVKLTNKFSEIAQLIASILDGFSRHAAARELTFVPPRDKVFSLNFKLDHQGLSDQQGTAISWQNIQELTIEKGTMAVLTYKNDYPTISKEEQEESF